MAKSQSFAAPRAGGPRRVPTPAASTAEPSARRACEHPPRRHAAARGRGEGTSGDGDVRRDRPALRPREPSHDVPDGCRLAADDGRVARAPTPVDRRRPRVRYGRPLPRAAIEGHRGDQRRLVGRHAARPTGAASPACAPTCLRLPLRDGDVDGATCGFALRNLRDLDTFFAELARVVRPGGRVALLEVATPTNPLLKWGHGVYFGTVVPFIGARLSDADAYRYLPRSVAYLPTPTALTRQLRERGLSRRDARRAVGGHRPAAHRDPPLIARTVRLDADVDLLAVAGADGFLFEEHGAGLAGAGVAARIPVAEAEERLAAIVTEDEVGLPGCGPVAFAALPFTLTPDAELVVPEVVVGRTADGTRWVTTIGAMGAPTPEITSTAVAPRPGWAADVRITSSRDPADWQAAVVTARGQDPRGCSRQGGARARAAHRDVRGDRRRSGCWRDSARRFLRASSTRSTE